MGLIEDFLELLREQNTPEGRDLKARRLAQKYEGGGIIGGPLMDAIDYQAELGEKLVGGLGLDKDPYSQWGVGDMTGARGPSADDRAITQDVVEPPDPPGEQRDRLDLPMPGTREDFERAIFESDPFTAMQKGGAQGIEFSGMTPDIVELIREQARNHPQLGGAAQTPGGGGAISMYDSNVTYNGEPIQQYHDREMGQLRDEQPYRQAEYELTNKQYGDPVRGAQIMAAMLQGQQAEMLPTQIAREYEVGMETARQKQRKNDLDEYRLSPDYLQAFANAQAEAGSNKASAPQQEQFAAHIRTIVDRLKTANPENEKDIIAAGERIINAVYSDSTLQTASAMLETLMGGGAMAQGGPGSIDLSEVDSFLDQR